MDKSLHVYYSGSVQGVGFRYTVERLAISLGIKGWVMNLPDGRVELFCEGKELAIKELLKKIDIAFKNYIIEAETEWGDPAGEYESFDIRFY